MGRMMGEVGYLAWYSTFCDAPRPAPPWSRLPLFAQARWTRVAASVVTESVKGVQGLAIGCVAYRRHVQEIGLRRNPDFGKEDDETKRRWYFVALSILGESVSWENLQRRKVEELL